MSFARIEVALRRLYDLVDADPAPRVVRHDGVSRIEVATDTSSEVFSALWDALVPPSGPAATLQGEAIRIAGRIRYELDGNGGVNWDRASRSMVGGLPDLLAGGTPLDRDDLRRAKALAKTLRRPRWSQGDLDDLERLAIAWVRRNPDPIPTGTLGYTR